MIFLRKTILGDLARDLASGDVSVVVHDTVSTTLILKNPDGAWPREIRDGDLRLLCVLRCRSLESVEWASASGRNQGCSLTYSGF